MLDEGVAQAPMDIDLAMITGAGFQFWNGGLTPLLDRDGRLRGRHGLALPARRRRQRPRLTGATRRPARHTAYAPGHGADGPARTGSVAPRRGRFALTHI